MAYTAIEYVKIGNVEELNRRFENTKTVAEVMLLRRRFVKQILENPEYGKQYLLELESNLREYKEDMENIVTAIETLQDMAKGAR